MRIRSRVAGVVFLLPLADSFIPHVNTGHVERLPQLWATTTRKENELSKSVVGSVVSTATVAAAAVARAVSMKTLTAPDLDQSFIALDNEASRRGDVDASGLPLVYNKALIEKYWAKEQGALQARWGEFLRYSVPFLTRVATMLITGGTEELTKNDASLARDARLIMEALGPTYIKLGQVLSVRPDILPQAALDELSILQDNVKPFATEDAVAAIEAELGGPLGAFFSEISDEPVAAASLAQVYRAKIASGPRAGTVVAVKVQRPGIRETVSKDLYVLRRAAEVYQGLIDRFAPQQRTDYVALFNEWAVGFYTELDFTNERSNQDLVRRLMAEQGVAGVYVPETFPELSTRKVLVTEWIDGIKLSQCEPSEIKELIALGQEAFLVQLLQVGVFHSDPHPGNLLRMDASMASKGRLALLDFGLVARLQQKDMDAIVSAIVHLANRDYPSLVDDFVGLGILPLDCDRSLVVPLMDKALTPYVKGGGAKRYEAELKKMYGFGDGASATVGNAVGGFQAMTNDLLSVLNDIPFSIPPYFALIGRAVVTLEGVALTGNPEYGIITEAYPFVARKLLREDRPEIQKALQEVLYGGGPGGSKGFSTQRLASLVNGALGAVAKAEGGTFVDLDRLPEDGASNAALLAFLLSEKAGSLWALLRPELLTGADLLLRQGLRRAATAAFALAPRPRLPFFGVLGPAPQDLPGPLLLPTRAAHAAGGGAAGGAAGGGLGRAAAGLRLAVVTPTQVVEALAPPLSREEELYALSLTDLVTAALGADAGTVVRGEGIRDTGASARVASLVLGALAERGDDSGALSSAAPAARFLSRLFPKGPHDAAADEAKLLLESLSPAERDRASQLSSELASALIAKLELRLGVL